MRGFKFTDIKLRKLLYSVSWLLSVEFRFISIEMFTVYPFVSLLLLLLYDIRYPIVPKTDVVHFRSDNISHVHKITWNTNRYNNHVSSSSYLKRNMSFQCSQARCCFFHGLSFIHGLGYRFLLDSSERNLIVVIILHWNVLDFRRQIVK